MVFHIFGKNKIKQMICYLSQNVGSVLIQEGEVKAGDSSIFVMGQGEVV